MTSKASNQEIYWFLNLRRFNFLAQVGVLIWAKFYLEFDLPAEIIFYCLLLFPIAEFLILPFIKFNRHSDKLTTFLLFYDCLILTAVLFFSGGPTNPFSILYFLQVVLTALLLDRLATWSMAVFASSCFGFLFIWHLPIHNLQHASHGNELALHFKGMFFSFALVTVLAAYFLNKILAERQAALNEISELNLKQQKLATMTAVTSDAAHSLGTPLASIHLIASELLAKAKNLELDSDTENDLILLKSEARRCKNIINELCTAAGNISLEQNETSEPKEIIEKILNELNFQDQEFQIIDQTSFKYSLTVPAISKALKAIIVNAYEAQKSIAVSEVIEIIIVERDNFLEFEIRDSGIGLKPEIENKMRNAFFTSKSLEKNLGLGVYIADLVAINLGGGLFYQSNLNSKTGNGTVAFFRIPALK
jgi:two-component system sensor histidine kinase RegB